MVLKLGFQELASLSKWLQMDSASERQQLQVGGRSYLGPVVGVRHSCDTSSGDFLEIFQVEGSLMTPQVAGWKYLQIDGDTMSNWAGNMSFLV